MGRPTFDRRTPQTGPQIPHPPGGDKQALRIAEEGQGRLGKEHGNFAFDEQKSIR